MFMDPVWNLLRVALLAARILGRFLHFVKSVHPYIRAAARYRHDSGYAEMHRWKTCCRAKCKVTSLIRRIGMYRLDPRIPDPDITWDRWPASRLRRFTPRKGTLGTPLQERLRVPRTGLKAALTLPGTEPPLLRLVRCLVTTISYVSWHTLHYRLLEKHSSFSGIRRGYY